MVVGTSKITRQPAYTVRAGTFQRNHRSLSVATGRGRSFFPVLPQEADEKASVFSFRQGQGRLILQHPPQ